MKHKQVIAQEPYEAPAILDIQPVTIGIVAGTSGEDNGEPEEHTDVRD